MVEHDEREKYLEYFKGEVDRGLKDYLDTLGLAVQYHVTPDPLTMGTDDERTFMELDKDEQEVIIQVTLKKLGISEFNRGHVLERQYNGGDGVEVTVYRTNRSHHGIYLHEMKYPDKMVQWVIGPRWDVE